jgi:hypothetical protein
MTDRSSRPNPDAVAPNGAEAAANREAAELEAELGADRELAAAWLDEVRKAPVAELAPRIARVAASHAGEPSVVLRACDVLIRLAERLPPDEPLPESNPASLAVGLAQRCLAEAAAATGDERAYLQMALANALRLTRAYAEALPLYETALAAYPERGTWWFNLGLLHKATGAFADALAANQNARARLGDDKAVLWNLAISATALGRGEDAAEALQKLGHPARVAASGMPYVEELPPVQVRAATLGSGVGSGSLLPDRSVGLELLWVSPISPCHGVVSSTSQRDAAIDYGDVVLWDAVPVGVAEHAGKKVPRFPLLALLRRGDERRFRFVALQQGEGQVAALGVSLPEGAQLFLHVERVEMLCARCASGEHMHKHRHEPPEEHRLVYGKLVLSPDVELTSFRSALEERLRAHPRVQFVVPGLLEAIGDTAAAGKAHQLWRGLERVGLRGSQ